MANIQAKDLTKEAPRSPKVKLGGMMILARAIDKGRATINGTNGLYNFDCPLDNRLFGFLGIKGADMKAYMAEGHTDEEITAWVKANGVKKTDAEIEQWNKEMESDNYSTKPPEKKAWLEGENKRLGLDKDGTLFDFLEADDKDSFK